MDYNRVYNQLIDRAKNRKLTCYIEKHHIIPKCMGGGDDAENIVDLTAREHFLAHKLLVEIHPTNHKLLYSLWLMAIGKKRQKWKEAYNVTSREYERLKIKMSENQKGKILSNKTKSKIASANSKQVTQYDLKGNVIRDFKSASDAERFILNKPNEHWRKLPSNISDCCRGKQKTAYGYIWKLKGDILDLSTHSGGVNKRNGRKVIYKNKTYPNVAEAKKQMGVSDGTFYKMVKNNEISYEY